MSPRSATALDRRKPARHQTGRRGARRAAARRRRAALALAVMGLAVIGIVLAMPLFEKAVQELTLPLSDQDVIRRQAAAERLDPALVAAVIYAETKFDSRTSSAGAKGLMQIMPSTAEFLARRSGATSFTGADLAMPAVNIAYGTYYLRFLLDHYRGDMMLAQVV